jgi:hypothetical protein
VSWKEPLWKRVCHSTLKKPAIRRRAKRSAPSRSENLEDMDQVEEGR